MGKHDDCCRKEQCKKEEKCKFPFCDKVVFISKRDVGRSGYVIDEPGVYKLCGDIFWSPAANGLAAITIRSSNVVLDLNQFHLVQDRNSGAINNIGVLIDNNVEIYNVVVENGTIDNLSAVSIWVNAPASSDLTRDLIFQDLVLTNSGRDQGSRGPYAIRDGFAGAAFWVGGLGLAGQPGQIIDNVTIRRVISDKHASMDATSYISGLPVGQPQNAAIAAAGLFGSYVSRMVFDDVQVNDISQVQRTARGITFASVTDVEVKFAKVSKIVTGEGGTGINFTPARHLRITDSSSTDLQALQVAVGTPTAARGAVGIGAPTSVDVVMERCYTANIRNLVGGIVGGFFLARSENTVLKDCIAEDIHGEFNGNPAAVFPRTYGFNVSSGVLAAAFGEQAQTFNGRAEIKDCQAININSGNANNAGGPSWGFLVEPFFGAEETVQPAGVLIKDCEAIGTVGGSGRFPVTGLPFSDQSAGFGVRNALRTNIVNVDAKAGVNANGVAFFGTLEGNGAVRDSRADENSGFGFLDATPGQQVLFTNNSAYKNGSPSAAGSNYFINPNLPLREVQMGVAFPTSLTCQWDNLAVY